MVRGQHASANRATDGNTRSIQGTYQSVRSAKRVCMSMHRCTVPALKAPKRRAEAMLYPPLSIRYGMRDDPAGLQTVRHGVAAIGSLSKLLPRSRRYHLRLGAI